MENNTNFNDRIAGVQKLIAEETRLRGVIYNSTNLIDDRKNIEELNYATLVRSREQEELRLEIKNKTNEKTKEENDFLKTNLDTEKKINTELNKSINNRKRIVDYAKDLAIQLKSGWKYLQDQDKIIKSTVLNLGMSSVKAVAMRDAFEQSAGYVTRLGGTIGDIRTIMEGYADETGRARAMTADMVKNITDIGKGTGLGIGQATRLGAQFELMGFDAKATMDYVQGVVDTSERMGVNTTKVLKNINTNFKKLNTYTFQQGVKGFAEMAMYAEKFKIDIGQALNAADVARSLDGAINLAAQLQVMGGEFARTDPFEMLFLSRNDPAKFTEKIADMTKGVVSFRKMSDGTFEKFISPADRDRLAGVAKSMGMEASALTEMAERQAEIQKMRQQMSGLGLSPKEKEIIEGAALFNKESGKFQVKIGGQMKSIGELTSTQAKAFESEQVLLKDRAKEAMTFDETFKATIETLKASLLPLLNNVNWLLDNTIKPIADLAAKGWGMGGAAAALLGAAAAWKLVTSGFIKATSNWIATGNIFKGGSASGIQGFLQNGGSSSISPTPDIGNGLKAQRAGIGAGAAAKGKGIKNLGTGAGIGTAALGIGGGVGLAAVGISKLADSMAKLDKTQVDALPDTLYAMAAASAAFTIPLAKLGMTAKVSSVGLVMLGVAALGIGAGIGIAAAGIGYMSSGLADLNNSGDGIGEKLFGIAGGIGAITAAMGFGGLLGLSSFAISLAAISSNSSGIEKIGAAFSHIKTVLSGTKDDFIAVENAIASIGNSNIKKGSMLDKLSDMMKKPLKVEFDKTSIKLINDITLEIDKTKFMNKIYDAEIGIHMNSKVINNLN